MQTSLDFSATRVTEARFGHHHKDASKTERRAAKKQVQVGGKKRLEVLRHIVAAGDVGITRHELSELHGLYIPSVCGRVRELLDGKWIYEAGERQNRAILRATDRGKAAATGSGRHPSPDSPSRLGDAVPAPGGGK